MRPIGIARLASTRPRALLSCLLLLAGSLPCASAPSPRLPRATPESQGVASSALLGFVEAADARIDSLHSLMLVRHGRVVAEGWWSPYTATNRHELYSLSKSFTSTAVGLAIDDQMLSLDDPVLKFFPDDAPAQPTDNLKSMRVRDLLSMSTGHQDEPSRDGGPSVRGFLAHPVPHKPGTHFRYNTPATYMLSAIVQKVTGQTVLDYLRPRLFEPLGIQDPVWGTSPEGVTLGGYGLSITTEDIAAFGQFLLQRGEWRGQRLVSEAWIASAAARQTSNGSNPRSDWDQGYGFQFWRCRHGAFRGDGAFGQYCIVLPEQDAVVAITAGVKDMQAVLDLVWDQLLPGLHPKRLRADKPSQARLSERLAGLQLRPQSGAATSSVSASAFGRRFVFAANDQKMDSMRIDAASEGRIGFLLRSDGMDHRLTLVPGRWTRTHFPAGPYTNAPVAVSGAWETPEVLALRMCLYETPFVVTHRFRFEGNQVIHQREANVGFGGTRSTELVGRAE